MLTFAPEGPRTDPNVLLDVSNYVALPNGNYRPIGGPFTPVTSTNLPGKCVGMGVPMIVDGTYRFFWAVNDAHSSATKTRLYRAATFGGSASNVSKSGNYTADTRWRFASMGNVIFATNNSNVPQYYLEGSSSLFDNISASVPDKAALVAVVQGWVFLADYQANGGGTTYRDGWICSALDDYTDWSSGSVNDQFSGRITDAGGPITALMPWGGGLLVFKKTCVVLLEPPIDSTGWYKRVISLDTGALTQECVVKVGNAVYWVDGKNRDFVMFDGSRPVSLTGGNSRGIWSRFFLQDTARSTWSVDEMANSIFGLFDGINRNLIWFYDSGDGNEDLAGYSKAFISCNVVSGKWGAGNLGINVDWVMADEYSPSQADGYLANRTGMHAIVTYYNSTNRVSYTLNGVTLANSFKTAYVGSNEWATNFSGLRPVFDAPLDSDVAQSENQIPTGGTMTLRYTNGNIHGVVTSMSSNTNFAWNTTEREFRGVGQDAKWASFEISLTPNASVNTRSYWELKGVEFLTTRTGVR